MDDQMKTPMHLSIGQEAISAAVIETMTQSDQVVGTYRSHGIYLAKTLETDQFFAELYGRVTGSSKGKAGSMHLSSPEYGYLGSSAIVGTHIPVAIGAAMANKIKQNDNWVAVFFGDGAIDEGVFFESLNFACLHGLKVMFVCEDNGLGISVHTPNSWVEAAYGHRDDLAYFAGNGLDIVNALETAMDAVEHVRSTRRPGFLHLKLVRLLGHAGSDVQRSYHSQETIEQAESQDPVFLTAKLLVEQGWATPEQLVSQYESIRARVHALGQEAITRPKIQSAEEIIAPQAPLNAEAVAEEVARIAAPQERSKFWKNRLPESDRPRHMAMQLNRALGDILVKYPESLIFGEDVAKKGGVYHVTAELSEKASVGRVFNTLLDEQSILGVAIGAGHLGYIPIPEIQYLAYLHNAEDQLRGEAASLSFFSQGQFTNPMVVRIASYAYQKGFGGHFHNDNSVAVLRDIPGLIIASPARADDAVAMLRTCMAAAKINGRICAFLEPIALYMTKDLHETNDKKWNVPYLEQQEHIPIGCGKTWRQGKDLTILTWANGLWMSLRVAERLEKEHGIQVRVFDIRWLNPLPDAQILEEAQATNKVLVVDETRATGGVSEGIFTSLIDSGYKGELQRVTAWDAFIPLGEAANRVLVQETDIEAAVMAPLGRSS